MKTIVLYSSKSGNTKKIADSIAIQLNCEAVKITQDRAPSSVDLKGYDLIFLGTGLFAGTPNEDIVKYLKKVSLETCKLFALLITWGGAPRSDKMALSKLRTLLEDKGQKVLDDHFAAFGGWKCILMKRGHPKSEEIQASGKWAKKVFADIENIT